MTLSVLIFRVPFLVQPTLTYIFSYTTHALITLQVIQVVTFPEQRTVSVTDHVSHVRNVSGMFSLVWNDNGTFQKTINLHVTSILCASRNRDYFLFKQALKIKYISK